MAEIELRIGELLRAPEDDLDWPALAASQDDFPDRHRRSQQLAADAAAVIAGRSHHTLATNSPFPLFFDRAAGAHVWDVDGNRYVDFVQAGGASILGGGETVATRRAMEVLGQAGPALAVSHPDEVELARFVCEQVPSVQRLRMTASGTEAAMAAVRIARAFTGAPNIVKVGSAYHGWSDHLVYALRLPGFGRRGVNGIPDGTLDFTHEVPPNDLDALRRTLGRLRDLGGTAAVVVEPLGPQSGTWPVPADYDREVAAVCREYGALLIFDEVVTGFRLGPSGVQGYLGIEPDLTIFGKCLTGGLPASGAVGGRADVMAVLDGGNPAFALVAGTLSANPISAAAGYATLKEMADTDVAGSASRAGDLLAGGLSDLVKELRLPFVVYNFGSIVHLHTSGLFHLDAGSPDLAAQAAARKRILDVFVVAALSAGLLLPATGRLFTGAGHTDQVIDESLALFENLFRLLAGR
ncbi:aminotransferase class III-fold pyridoxal phosphate-dependent enzyme [Kribbella sp. NPDC051718]|uniref:aspartate aminotransferase family protein n=1 Tax=Kribbella sp. NPDC051718 TaxID=3155168 RepID=UPI00342CD49B